jgi:DNA polymerase III subunit delta'
MSEFKSLPWLQDNFDKLAELESTQQIGHAYLIQGQKGLGKESLVRDFSTYLFCQQNQEQAACGHCQACHLLSAGTHPDFKFITVEEGATQIKIEQIRDSRNFLANTPLLGKYKILFINFADKMNINAANALLKNLEEPAPDTLIFLLSHQPVLLLPTIRSRCQKIKISRPSEEIALSWLQQHMNNDQAKLCLQLAFGAPLQALIFADEERQHERREIQKRLLELLRSEIVCSDAAKCLGQYPIEDVLDNLMVSLQQLSRGLQLHNTNVSANVSSDPISGIEGKGGTGTNDNTKELNDIAMNLTAAHIKPLHKFNSVLTQTRSAVQSTANPNALLLLESVCFQWIRLMTGKTEMEALTV